MNASIPPVLRSFFRRPVQYLLLIIAVMGGFTYFRFPAFFFQPIILETNYLLVHYLNTNGRISTVDLTYKKFGIFLVLVGVGGTVWLNLWKKVITSNSIFDLKTYEHSTCAKYFSPKQIFALLLGLTVLGAGLRFFPLNQSLYADEISSLQNYIEPGLLATIIPRATTGAHPFWQLLIGILTYFTGVSEWSLRLPAFLIAVLSIPLSYFFVVKMTKNQIVALTSSLLLTFHSFHIYYSFQFKGYSFVVFIVLVSLYLTHQLFEQPRRSTSCYLALVNILMIYTHLYTLLFFLAQHAVILFWAWLGRHEKKAKTIINTQEGLSEYLIAFLLTSGVSFILYTLQTYNVAMLTFGSPGPWPPILPHVLGVTTTVHNMIAYTDWTWPTYFYLGLIATLAATIPFKTNHINYMIFPIAPVLFSLTAVLPLQVGYFPRYIISLLPILMIILAILVGYFSQQISTVKKGAAGLLVLIYLVLNASGFSKVYQPIQDWRGAVEYVHQQNKQGNPVYAYSLGKLQVVHYDKKIIPLNNVEHFQSALTKYDHFFVINSYDHFPEDKSIGQAVKKRCFLERTFTGEFPVNIWACKGQAKV